MTTDITMCASGAGGRLSHEYSTEISHNRKNSIMSFKTSFEGLFDFLSIPKAERLKEESVWINSANQTWMKAKLILVKNDLHICFEDFSVVDHIHLVLIDLWAFSS